MSLIIPDRIEYMKKTVLGILAHVDSGKTTLSEALLYETGAIRSLGRVDHKDAHLDTNANERQRGITIYSKTARFTLNDADMEYILVDTPGHVDFGPETERALGILDAAILVVSASAKVQAHTKTLWSLLNKYNIPTYIFVNKMDMPDTDKTEILRDIQKQLSTMACDFSNTKDEQFYENIATADEAMLNEFLESDSVSDESIRRAISDRKIFPVCFGSALKLTGIKELADILAGYPVITKDNSEKNFAGVVYKIAPDNKGQRMTFIKVLEGELPVKSFLNDEKINEIRLYNGENYESVKLAERGEICAVLGPCDTRVGDSFGKSIFMQQPVLTPVMGYAVKYPDDVDCNVIYKKLVTLGEEDPSLNVSYNTETGEINMFLMGDVQAEILKNTIRERFDVEVEFADGKVLYKETIDDSVEGVGHFEPLRHYAETHIMLSPNKRGEGMTYEADIPVDNLALNWQRLIYTHMTEKNHTGVLIGAPITDIHLKLVSGKDHLKHTEGGDFRQATYRAIRQGLMMLREGGHCRVLEPYYEYTLELPTEYVGRALTDITAMSGNGEVTKSNLETGESTVCGRVPVAEMNGYSKDVQSYTKGLGRLYLKVAGYDICHNEQEIIDASSYDAINDPNNLSCSVFCSHGAGVNIPWDEVPEHMHIPYQKQR